MSRPAPVTCSRCQRTWRSLREAHCAGCHEHFSSPTAFDAHQTGAGEVVCHPPADRGLEQRTRPYGTVWVTPADGAWWDKAAS